VRIDDSSLVRAVLRGDPEPFRELVERHAAAVFRVVRSAASQAHDADDLAQEVFAAAYRALAKIKDPARFRPYVLSIAARKSADHLRRRRARPSLPLLEEPPAPPPPPRASLLDAVADAVDALPPETRLLVALRHHEGLSCLRIAEVLGLTPSAVYTRLSRAHAALRRALEVRGP